MNREIWIVAAKRCAFGTFGGALKDLTANDLAVVTAKAALAQCGASANDIDQVVFGNVAQTSVDAIYLARHVGLRSGLAEQVPALTVNRLCGSGFQAVITGAQEILTGCAETVLCGGTESMSQSPHVLRGARWGLRLGAETKLEDTLWAALTDSHVNLSMALTAENLAAKYQISRQACDEYALLSQKRWAQALEAGRFREEIAPITLKSKKGEMVFATDEHPRGDSTLEGLAKLQPVFKKEGVVTAGNASGMGDGAAALVITTDENARRRGWTGLARVAGWQVVGCDPSIMGIGPAPAIRGLLGKLGRTLSDCDLVEVNEAFAAQYLAVEKELGLPRDKTNVSGGAVAMSHPLGASGARIAAHLVYELRWRKAKFGIGSACIGGGQGIALALESL